MAVAMDGATQRDAPWSTVTKSISLDVFDIVVGTAAGNALTATLARIPSAVSFVRAGASGIGIASAETALGKPLAQGASSKRPHCWCASSLANWALACGCTARSALAAPSVAAMYVSAIEVWLLPFSMQRWASLSSVLPYRDAPPSSLTGRV